MSTRRNGGKNGGDYANLPSTESENEGDGIGDKRIPPKLRKKVKSSDGKRSSFKSGSSGDTSVCSIWVMLKIIVVIVTLATLAVLGIVSYWLLAQVNDLRVQLQEVENRNQGAPEEFQKYHSQIQDLNRTLNTIRTGDKGIDKIAKNLTNVANQLSNLNEVTSQVKEGLQNAPYLKTLPNKMTALTSTVTAMGSDVQLVQGKADALEDFQKKALEDLEDLKQKVSAMQNTSSQHGPAVGREQGSNAALDRDSMVNVASKLQTLTQQIDKLNTSIAAKLEATNTSLSQLETRLGLLESFTSQQKSKDTSADDETANALNELLNGGAESVKDGEQDPLEAVLTKVGNITDQVMTLGLRYEQLQQELENVNNSVKLSGAGHSMEEFAGFQSQVLISVEYLNATVQHLNDSVVQLFRLFTQNRNELNNITAHMNGIRNYISNNNNFHPAVTVKPVVSETVTTTPASTPEHKVEDPSKTMGTTAAPAITIEKVSNMEDLKKHFNRWDRNGVGQVNPDDLQDYMASPPSPEELKPFDADNNGKYSLEEMAAALGFKTVTDDEVKKLFE